MFHPANLGRVSKLCPIFVAILLVVLVSAGLGRAEAQGVPATGNIAIRDGSNPGEVVVSFDAVSQATHYRIGYVNMVTDYPLAKASATGDWINAFIYVDENARNLRVSGGRAEYTVRRLQQGARHAFTVLTSGDFTDTGGGGSVSSEFAWPTNPRWTFHAVSDRGGACPTTSPLPARDCVADGTCIPVEQVGTFTGSGDSAHHIVNLGVGLHRVTSSHRGPSNFIVHLINVSSGRTEYLANEIGNADGVIDTFVVHDDGTSFRTQAGNHLLQVQAGGQWTVQVERIAP